MSNNNMSASGEPMTTTLQCKGGSVACSYPTTIGLKHPELCNSLIGRFLKFDMATTPAKNAPLSPGAPVPTVRCEGVCFAFDPVVGVAVLIDPSDNTTTTIHLSYVVDVFVVDEDKHSNPELGKYFCADAQSTLPATDRARLAGVVDRAVAERLMPISRRDLKMQLAQEREQDAGAEFDGSRSHDGDASQEEDEEEVEDDDDDIPCIPIAAMELFTALSKQFPVERALSWLPIRRLPSHHFSGAGMLVLNKVTIQGPNWTDPTIGVLLRAPDRADDDSERYYFDGVAYLVYPCHQPAAVAKLEEDHDWKNAVARVKTVVDRWKSNLVATPVSTPTSTVTPPPTAAAIVAGTASAPSALGAQKSGGSFKRPPPPPGVGPKKK
eukprot:PhM_4_TR5533/c0_g1_i2/m.106452